jgi:hypothetical protein
MIAPMVVTLIAVTSVVGCHKELPSPQLPADFEWVTKSNDPLQWQRQSFVEIVTPVRPPTSKETTAHISVFVRIPDGKQVIDGNWPNGSEAARIEYAGTAHAPDAEVAASWRVLDVRAFEWTPRGMFCTVLRPNRSEKLVGLRWPCSLENDRRASELLQQFVIEERFIAPSSATARQNAAQHLASINRCVGCHQVNRAEDRSVNALVQRGTDRAGLFSVRSAFRDEDPAERYRPVDSNVDDPWFSPVCPDSHLDVAASVCQNGQRPRLRYDLAGARAANAPHAARLCASRIQLAPFFNDATRSDWKTALAACGQ